MNKLLIFPMVVMIIVAFLVILMGTSNIDNALNTGVTPVANGNFTINGNTGQVSNGYVQLNSGQYSLASATTIIAVTVAGIVLAIALGVSVLGSGISALSQEMTLKLIVYGGLWGLLTGVTLNYFTQFAYIAIPFGLMIYIILTLMYCLGFVGDIKAVSD